ncbi:MAG: Mth938-like domain-containing protein [Qingshengfaniella sp.]
MRLTEIDYDTGTPVDGYGPGFFRIGGRRIAGGMRVLPGAEVAQWAGYDDLAPLIAAAPRIDVLFIGTGAAMAYLPPAFRDALEGAGIGAEPMASPAACRTYNVLLSEGRRVGLAVLPV